MLKTVSVANLKPNPFRRLEEYPIIREKIDALKESISSTGFWGTIVGRPNGNGVEIAFGHHRLQALKESGVERVEIIVRDLSNEQMLKMMARENLEEWGTSAWVELETIRSTIEAYGKGLIELPKVHPHTKKEDCQGTGSHLYTRATIAEFLGWTRKAENGGIRANYACETAFKALDMIDAGFLGEADLKGLKRTQLADLIKEQWSIFNAEKRIATAEKVEAERAEEQAKSAPEPQRARLEKKAAIHREQSEQHDKAAASKTKAFGKEGAELFRADRGRDAVKQRADELRPSVERPAKVIDVDDVLFNLSRKLEQIANSKDEISADVRFITKHLNDSSQRARERLCDSFLALIDRIERMRDSISPNTRSHVDGTRGQHAQIAEGNGRFKNR